MITIVSKSLHWPTKKNLKDFGEAKTINHPQDIWELSENSIDFERWLSRLATVLRLTS